MDTLATVTTIVRSLHDKKATDVVVIDVRGISTITDYLVIAEGAVNRHVSALSHNVQDTLKKECKQRPVRVEGESEGQWVVVDYVDVMVHVFQPEARSHYQLELLFPDAPRVDIDISAFAT